MSGGFRDRIYRFMSGRYGLDELGRTLSVISLVLMIISWFLPVFSIPAVILLIYLYFRILSRNFSARRAENQWFLRVFHSWKRPGGNPARAGDRTHRIFKCPNCSQKIRVPRGKGRICIKCPKCRIEFIKKT